MSGHEVITSCVRSYSEKNRRILQSFVIGEVQLVSRVRFCIVGSIISVYGYLGAICSGPEAKVTQGHACHGPFPWLFAAVIILNLQLS